MRLSNLRVVKVIKDFNDFNDFNDFKDLKDFIIIISISHPAAFQDSEQSSA